MAGRQFPAGLKARGRSVWREITAVYVLDPAETALLVELCRTVDELDRLTAAMAEESPVVEGSTGQPKAHPLLGEIRLHRKLAESLSAALALPVAGESVGRKRSTGARIAAQARWKNGKGA